MVENLDLPNAKAVLEYGPGTGSFTEYIVQRFPPASKFVAIELNPKPGGRVQSKVSQIKLVQDSVAKVRTIL